MGLAEYVGALVTRKVVSLVWEEMPSQTGRATAYWYPQRSHLCQLWNIPRMWGTLAVGLGDFGMLLVGS